MTMTMTVWRHAGSMCGHNDDHEVPIALGGVVLA